MRALFSTPNLHLFSFRGRNYLFDGIRLQTFILDQPAAELLRAYRKQPLDVPEQIPKQVGGGYSEKDLQEALGELSLLRQAGFLQPRGSLEHSPEAAAAYWNWITVDLGITRRCNLRCVYCPLPHDESQWEGPLDMSEEVARRAVDFFLTEFDERIVGCTFSATNIGEYTLRAEFAEWLAEYCPKRAKELGRMANFTVCTSNFTNPGKGCWGISLDGPRHIHDALRPTAEGAGSYDCVISALKSCQEAKGGQPVCVHAALTGLYPDITQIFLHLSQFGFPWIGIRPVRVPTQSELAVNAKTLPAFCREYTEFVDFLLQQEDGTLLSALRRLDDLFNRYLQRIWFRSPHFYRCPAGRSLFVVDPAGDVYPCYALAAYKPLKIGSVYEGISEETRRFFWHGLAVNNKPVCKECWARYVCGGGCHHASYLATGTLARPDPYRCQLKKHLVRLAIYAYAELLEQRKQVLQALLLPAPPTRAIRPEVFCTFLPNVPDDATSPQWHSSAALVFDSALQMKGRIWRGPADLTARISLRWDKENFYLAADVQDDVFLPSRAEFASSGDQLEFAFVPPPLPREPRPRVPNYFFVVSHDPPRLICHDSPDRDPERLGEAVGQVAVRRDERTLTTTYRITIPWTQLSSLYPQVGETFGFYVCICDDDGEGPGYVAWPSKVVAGLDFGLLRLV